MPGPGEYVPDVTEGVTRPEDLPAPRVECRSRNYAARCCPRCSRRAGRYGRDTRLLPDLAAPKSPYTHRVQRLAVRLVVEDALPYRAASWHLGRDHRVFVPYATIQNWVEDAGENKAGPRWPPSTATRRWLTSPATWPSTRPTMGRSASFRSWTIAATTGWPSRFSTTTRPRTTSACSSRNSRDN